MGDSFGEGWLTWYSGKYLIASEFDTTVFCRSETTPVFEVLHGKSSNGTSNSSINRLRRQIASAVHMSLGFQPTPLEVPFSLKRYSSVSTPCFRSSSLMISMSTLLGMQAASRQTKRNGIGSNLTLFGSRCCMSSITVSQFTTLFVLMASFVGFADISQL